MKPSLKPTRQASEIPAPSNRAWQRMLSGRRLDLLDPSPLDIEIEDIAHGLARVARWNGQTTGDHALSVAQHALIVEEICRDRQPNWPLKWCRAALLHDAAEYVVGDLISPFKNAIGLDYRALENRLLEAIHVRFSLPAQLPKTISREIKSADRISAFFEATALAGFAHNEAEQFFGKPPALSKQLQASLESLEPWPARDAQIRLLKRFQTLNELGA
ncbi:MAG: HD family hydrolase [Pseudomonadota bacterium]